MPGLHYSKEVVDGSSASRGTLLQEQTTEESTPLLSLLFLLLSGYAMEPHTRSSYQVCTSIWYKHDITLTFFFILEYVQCLMWMEMFFGVDGQSHLSMNVVVSAEPFQPLSMK